MSHLLPRPKAQALKAQETRRRMSLELVPERQTIPAYGLSREALQKYLEIKFSNERLLNSIDLASDSDEYFVYLPRKLNKDEREKISHIKDYATKEDFDKFIEEETAAERERAASESRNDTEKNTGQQHESSKITAQNEKPGADPVKKKTTVEDKSIRELLRATSKSGGAVMSKKQASEVLQKSQGLDGQGTRVGGRA